MDFQGAVVHWDSKLLSHILKKENVERLAILISFGEEEQFISISQVANNKGFTQARAVFSEVKKRGALEKMKQCVLILLL